MVVIAIPLIIEARRKQMNAAARQKANGDFVTLSQRVTYAHADQVLTKISDPRARRIRVTGFGARP